MFLNNIYPWLKKEQNLRIKKMVEKGERKVLFLEE
jgi:hypothetical protein